MKTTDDLLELLSHADTEDALSDYIADPAVDSHFATFADYYTSLENVRNTDNSVLISNSNIERTYWYQIINKTRAPGRDKVIAMCIAASLSLGETQRALEISGTGPLYPRNRRDAIIIYSINNGMNLDKIQELLSEYGEKTID